jgi:acetyltransferase
LPSNAEHLLRPKSIAIIGASDSSRGGWAQSLFKNIEYAQPDAKLFLINPKRTELWGRKVYPNFSAIGEPVDLGLCVIPSAAVVDTLTEAAESGLRCALIYAAQFGEGGDAEGAARAQALLQLRDRYGLRVSGPNCMGSLSLRERLLLYPAERVRAIQQGSVGIVFQSGGTFQYWLQQATVRGLGFSYAVSSGNELDLTMADYLDFLVEDENTRVIACLAEGIRKPDAFMASAAKALRAGKPIVIVKGGRSARGKQAAASHTGALAGDDAVFDAMCRAYGIIRCDTLDDMIETCLAFQAGRLPDNRGVGIVTFSGSSKGLMLDYAEDAGVDLPSFSQDTRAKLAPHLDAGLAAENPLDVGATVARQYQRFADVCKIVAADDNVGTLLIQGSLPFAKFDNQDPSSFADLASATQKPVLAWSRTAQNVTDEALQFQAKAGMPFLQGMPQTVRAAARLIRFAESRKLGTPTLAPMARPSTPLSAAAMNDLIEQRGIALPRSRFVTTAAEAARAAEEIGFPVALKIVSPDALHKTEVGGVALGLRSAADVTAAADAMTTRLRQSHAAARIDGFLVQEIVRGLELILGARTDPIYGPFLMVGLGGVQAEALRDTAISLLPVDERSARAMLQSLRAKALLGAFRGQPPCDVEAVVAAMLNLGQIFLENRNWLGDIEINPLIVREIGQGVRAVDIRLVPRAQAEAH